MSLVAAILLGVAVGALVELALPGHTLSEGLLTGLLGVAGSLAARFIGEWAGWFWTDEPRCLLSEVLGAVLILILYLLTARRHRRRAPQRQH